jgi:periplasmic protein TonB
MKTSNKAVAKTMAVSLDEVIFSNRNQNYGAFYLRKKYTKHLFIAMLLVVPMFLIGTGSIFYKYSKSFSKFITKPVESKVVVNNFSEDFEIPKPPPPPPAEQPQPTNHPNQSGPPEVVDSVYETPPQINLLTFENTNPNDSALLAYLPYNKPENDPIDENDEPYIGVQESATFNGGTIEQFVEWIQKKLIYPADAAENSIQGRVNVTFIINKKGEICDVNILRGVHPLIDRETIRVLMSSPKWIPAKQNGRPVKQLFSIPIYFVIH